MCKCQKKETKNQAVNFYWIVKMLLNIRSSKTLTKQLCGVKHIDVRIKIIT